MERDLVAPFGEEGGAHAAVREVVAVEVVRGRSAAGEEIVQHGRQRGGVLLDDPAGHVGAAPRQAAVAGGVGEGLDAAHDEAVGVGHGSLAAQGRGIRGGGGFDLALVHAVEVAIQVPGRSADDAAGPVVRVGGGVAVGETDVGVGQRVVLQRRTFVAGRRQAHAVGGQAVGVEEVGGQRDLVGEAESFRRLFAVAVADQADGRSDT